MNTIVITFAIVVIATIFESASSVTQQKRHDAGRTVPQRIVNSGKNGSTLPGSCAKVKSCCPGRIDGCMTQENCYCDEFCYENGDCCEDFSVYCKGKVRCWEVDSLKGNPCNKIDAGATCTDSTEDPQAMECHCSPGYVFVNAWSSCAKDVCSGNPCGFINEGNGICTINDDLQTFSCKCSEGFSGAGCEPVSPCANGQCCKSGYILGKNKKCIIMNGCMNDDVDWNPCNDKGDTGSHCLPGFSSDSYSCSCSSGWLFDTETCVDPCKTIDCGKGGFCVEGNCFCNPGFTLMNGKCTQVDSCGSVDKLDGNPCNNNGDYFANCSFDATSGSYSCKCSKGWIFSEGVCKDMCSLTDPVDRNPCNDNGDSDATCYMQKGGYSCSCSPGWIFVGGSCKGACALADFNDRNPCNNHGDSCGTCKIHGGGYVCECSPGFQSVNGMCIDINECQEQKNVCNDCGMCRNTVGGFFCVCGQGYRVADDGRSCESTLTAWLNVLGIHN